MAPNTTAPVSSASPAVSLLRAIVGSPVPAARSTTVPPARPLVDRYVETLVQTGTHECPPRMA